MSVLFATAVITAPHDQGEVRQVLIFRCWGALILIDYRVDSQALFACRSIGNVSICNHLQNDTENPSKDIQLTVLSQGFYVLTLNFSVTRFIYFKSKYQALNVRI